MADEAEHWRQYTESNTLGVGDMPNPFEDWTVRIARVTGASVKYADGPTKKPMIHFEGVKKPLAAGATVCSAITALHATPKPSRWVGKLITLYATTCNSFGKGDVDCLRVRPTKPRDDNPPAKTDRAYDVDSAIARIRATKNDLELTALRGVITAEKPPASCRPAIKAAIDEQIELFAQAKRDEEPPAEATL